MTIQNDPHASRLASPAPSASAASRPKKGARQRTPEERIAFLRKVFPSLPEVPVEIARNPLFLRAIEKAEAGVLEAERRFRAEVQSLTSDWERRLRDQGLEEQLELEEIKRGPHADVCPQCRRTGRDECAGWITSGGPQLRSVPYKDPHMPMAEPDQSRWYTTPEACKKLGVSRRELDRMAEAGWFFPHPEPMLMAVGFPRHRRPRGYLRARIYNPAQIDAFAEAAEKLRRGEYSKTKEWILLAQVASTRHSPKRLRRSHVGSSANVPAALISGPDWLTAVVPATSDYERYYEEAAEKLRQQGENGEMKDFILWQALQHACGRYQLLQEQSLLKEGFDRERAERMARGKVSQMLAASIHRPDWIKVVAVQIANKCADDDEAYVSFAQEHVFQMGSYWRKRTQLVKYLSPQYEIAARLMESSEDQLAAMRLRGELKLAEIHRVAEIMSANDAAVYVKQSIEDLHRVRHWTKLKPRFKLQGELDAFDEGEDGQTEVIRLTVGRDETGKRIERYRAVCSLESFYPASGQEINPAYDTAVGRALITAASQQLERIVDADLKEIGRALELNAKEQEVLVARLAGRGIKKRDADTAWRTLARKIAKADQLGRLAAIVERHFKSRVVAAGPVSDASLTFYQERVSGGSIWQHKNLNLD